MRQIVISFLIIGTCAIVSSLPAPPTTTQSALTEQPSTEKVTKGPSSVTSETKSGKEGSTVPPSTTLGTTKLSEHAKEGTTKSPNEQHSTKVLDATASPTSKHEQTTSNVHKEETKISTTAPSVNKPESKGPSTVSSSGYKVESTSPTPTQKEEPKGPTTASPSGHKEPITSLPSGQKVQTAEKPKEVNKAKQSPSKKPTKTSTAYIDEGKVVIFNGICGPEGCEIEGDIYDEIVPIAHKQG